MKVLQINSVCGIGSTGRIAVDLHQLLIARGHESVVAFGRGEPRNCSQTIRIGSRHGWLLHVLLTFLTGKHGFGSTRATRILIREIQAYDPDIIHLHNIHGFYLNMRVLFDYLSQAGKPVFWTLHDTWSFTGHCSGYEMVGCNKWQTQCEHCPQLWTYPFSLLRDRSRQNYLDKKALFNQVRDLTLITPSRWLKDQLSHSFLRCHPVQVIPNGINLDSFKPSPSDFRHKHGLKDKFVILGVSSVWEKRKGLGTFAELSEVLPMDDFAIVLVGVNSYLRRRLPASICCIPKTNSVQELAEIYSAVDVFLNPTLEDNFPTTNLEALACGIPVITFRTGGSVESVTEHSGLIVEKGDIAGLMTALAEIRQKGKVNYSESCQTMARQHFNKDTNYLQYMTLYETALKGIQG
jgi:glycosyltransferase involved in cell wall biosynthesis